MNLLMFVLSDSGYMRAARIRTSSNAAEQHKGQHRASHDCISQTAAQNDA
jgi:hypothetical protein